MEFGEMKRNTSNWRCFYVARVWQRQLGFLVRKEMHNIDWQAVWFAVIP